MSTSDSATQGPSDAPGEGPPRDTPKETHRPTRGPTIIVGIVAAAVAALSLFYLLRPEPLLVQGEADATRLDIAARVDGRVKQIPVERGQNVAAGAVLVAIDNPETVAKLEQMKAAKAVAEAQNANVLAGTRVESIAAKKAEMERAQASLVLAQKTFDRTNTLTAARQCAAIPPRPGDRRAARERARGRSGDLGLSAGGQRLHQGRAGDRQGQCREGRCRYPERSIGHRPARGLCADRLAGLPAQCRARRICLARRAAGDPDRPRRCLDPLRSARGSGQRPEGRRQIRRPHSRRSATARSRSRSS